MSQFLKSIQPTLNEIVYDITGLTLTDRFNPFKKLFEDAIIYRSNVSLERIHVKKELEGLKDKYYIHAQDKKSDLLDFLIKHFNNRPLLGHPPDSDFHQACLKLIVNIACRPLEVKLDDFNDLLHEQIEESQFDWTRYLLNSDIAQHTILSIDIEHDDDESIDDEQNDLTVLPTDVAEETEIENETKSIDSVEKTSLSVLNQEVITSYWHRDLSNDVSPFLRDFGLFWDRTMINSTHLAYRVNCQTLTEYIVIRESLWVLMDIYPVHIFTISPEKRIDVVDFIRLCDATPIALQESLQKIIQLANHLNVACTFLKKQLATCRTLTAFSQVLQNQIDRIHYDLADIEQRCLQQDSTYTLLSFVQELESLDLFAKGKCIEKIFSQLYEFLSQPNCDLTLELIHLLYENLHAAEMLDSLSYFNFYFPLFIGCCRIYFEIIESWLNTGVLTDPFDEFFIKRKVDVSVDSIEFWSFALTEQVQNASLIPKWLARSVPLMIKAGKCAEILKFNKVLQLTSNSENELSLFEAFLKTFEENLNIDEQRWNPIEILRKKSRITEQSLKPSSLIPIKSSFDNIDDEKNSFLALAFQRMRDKTENLLEINRSTLKLKKTSRNNLEMILEKFSQTHLMKKTQKLIDQLTEDLFVRMKYLTHMKGIRDFFLFENGSLMHQFASKLYSKLSQTIHERLDAFTVLVSFESTLNMFGLDKMRYPLSVLYQSSTNEPPSVLQKYIIQNVQLKYDLPKELFIIIQPEQMDIYQKSFAFVLQVKQAKYVLDQLVFIEFRVKTRRRNRRLYRHQSYQLHHQMFLLRARLLHAVNAVNNFVLTTFHTAGEEFFKRNSENSIDIESMVDFHDKFLRALSIGALLHPKQQAIRDYLMKLFEIVTIFARRWQLGFDSIKVEHIEKLTNEFNQTKQFITTVLKPFLPRMIDSPLRALACALQDDFYAIH